MNISQKKKKKKKTLLANHPYWSGYPTKTEISYPSY